MTFGATIGWLTAPLNRWINCWYDQAQSGIATQIFILLFVVSWTAFHILANASIDLHFDLTETYVWGHHPSAGYYKHPPLVGWVAMVWFAVFPAADWSFHLLAMTNAAVALLAVDLISRRYLSGDKRLLVLMLLLLLPFYQFHSQRISTNQLLLSTWPIATYCFLRAFETRNILWSAAVGAMAAAAMLGKYYSIYLIAAFIIAALTHPARWIYLRSPSPWISAAVGLAALAPHLHWLMTVGSGPFDYAYNVHGSASTAALIGKSGRYLLGAIGYIAFPTAIYLLAVRPDRRTLADAFWPADPNRRQLVVLLAAMLLLPAFTAPLIGIQLSSLWTMSAWFLLPIVLLAPPSAVLPRPRAVHAAMIVTALTAGALLAAPVIAWVRHSAGTKEGRAYYRLVSERLAAQWRQSTAQPLRIVLSTFDIAAAVTFYHPDHPDSAPYFNLGTAPWITPERLKRDGWAMICPAEDAECVREADRRRASAADARRAEIDVTRYYLGQPSKPARFVLVLAPPIEPGGGPEAARNRPR